MARKKAADEAKEMHEEVRFWLSEIAAARKREQDYRKDGRRVREIYAGSKPESTPFNVLHSNTEIMVPALYSQTPRPVVERRYKDKDPIGLAAAQASKRCLEFLIDTNIDGYETFTEAMKSATMDATLPGRGIAGVQYDAEIKGAEGSEVKASELVCVSSKSWDRVIFGYARKWSKMPWIAYELHLDAEEATRLFGKAKADDIQYTAGEGEESEERTKADKNTGERKTAKVYQIWDKEGGRKIRYVSAAYPDDFLKVSDDTLGLSGFYDIPRPLMFIEKTDDMVPTAPYKLYENQAQELNKLTIRINKIVSAMKARGAYDAALGDTIGNIFDGEDNELVPTDKGASLAAERGLGNSIWFVPLEVLQSTLQQLYVAREQCKQVIYEITGISDIVRGASKASETLGAQELKSQWGTLRLKNKQAEVQRYACDMLRMMLEIAASKFSEKTWARMTGLPYLTEEQFAQGTAQLQAMQQQAMAMQQAAQVNGQQIPPEMQAQAQQQIAQLQQQMQAPQWKQVLEILRDDMQRGYRIDIETNSTIAPEAAEDQKNIAELMNALGQFLNGVGPMVAQGIMPFEVAKTMLTTITRRFRFGSDIEGQIEQMTAPKPQDDGSAQKAQAQAAQEKIQGQQKVVQLESEKSQLETKLAATTQQQQLDKRAAELDNRERILNDEEARLKMERAAANESLTNRSVVENTKLDAKKQLTSFATSAAKTEQQTAKAADSKLSQTVSAMQSQFDQLGKSQSVLLQLVTDTTKKVDAIEKVAKAPRKRRAIRGADGLISHTVDEPMEAAQ